MEVGNLGSSSPLSLFKSVSKNDDTQSIPKALPIKIFNGCFLGRSADNDLLTTANQPVATLTYEPIVQSSKFIASELAGGERTCGKLIYDQSHVIGRGSSGVSVHIGCYGATREKVAAKRFNKTFITDVSVILREVEVMKRANNHPNILRFFGSEMDENFLFIVTELCSGTLEDYVKKNYIGPMFKSEKEILYQMTKGLKYLHDLGIVHRDIKPTNILIHVPNNEDTPSMKLADFGLSKALKSDQRLYSNSNVINPSGTIGWMAPEMYRSDRFDSKADIFPLGINYYYTLTGGRHPFGNDYIVRLMRIRNKERAFLEQRDFKDPYCYDSEALDLINSMLNMEPEDRPTATDILKQNFFEDCRLDEATKKGKRINDQQNSMDSEYEFLDLSSGTATSQHNQPITNSLSRLNNPWWKKLGSKLIYDPMAIVAYSSFRSMVYRGLFDGKRDVAVKRILRNPDQDFAREVKLMLRVVEHPNILRYYCCEMDSDFLYIATDLCQGNLEDYVEGKYKGPKIGDERDILLQTTKGLAYLHSLNIIHRDIKPTNILIYQPEVHMKPLIKLADFSISEILRGEQTDTSNTSMTNPAGSRGWMAPEQYNSTRYGQKVDIFALGCVFGYTLSIGGKHPFGNDIDDRIYFVKRGMPMILTNEHLKGRYSEDGLAFILIRSMLNWEPDYRPTALEILKDVFFEKLYAF